MGLRGAVVAVEALVVLGERHEEEEGLQGGEEELGIGAVAEGVLGEVEEDLVVQEGSLVVDFAGEARHECLLAFGAYR